VEIREYTAAVLRRSRLVGAIVAVALVLAVVVFLVSPRTYRSTATVVIPGPGAAVSSLLAAVTQSVEDFRGALESDAVALKVSRATGIDPDVIEAGLKFEQVGKSSVAEISFVSTDEGRTEQVALLAGQEALVLLMEARKAPLEEQRELAESQYREAQAAYDVFLLETGIGDPAEWLRRQTIRLIGLQDDLGVARGVGNDVEVARLQKRLDDKHALVGPVQAEYSRLSAARDRGLAVLAESNRVATAADAALRNVQNSGAQITVSPPRTRPWTSVLLGIVVPAVVIATALAIALVVLLEIVGPTREVRALLRTIAPDRAAGAKDPRASRSNDLGRKAGEE
jgi:hypothetical protein